MLGDEGPTVEQLTIRVAAGLVGVKLVHTIIWAFFAACIIAIPVLALMSRFGLAVLLNAVVLVEVAVIVVNGGRCPLTTVAARFTSDRRDNFDIYLPQLLARYNKQIFGSMYFVDLLLTAYLWTTHAT